MEQGICCPVCTLYLRKGITLEDHLETHPKGKVIEALLRVTNGKTGQPTQSPGSQVKGYTPPQPYVAPNTSFVSQTQNYVHPQTQVTAALTYQQFVTSNGSTVLPQYIQVPAIVGPNSNGPVVPNQTLNYVPNQQNAYAHTMYNPLYNPYIPQPYPLVQPMYTNMPVTSVSNTQVPSNQVTNGVTNNSETQTPVAGETRTLSKKVSTVGTNTNTGKKGKKLPIKSTTQTKLKIIKQLGSRVKTTTSTLATVATKSYRITNLNCKTNPPGKTSVITKIKSFRAKHRPLLPKLSSAPASLAKSFRSSRTNSIDKTSILSKSKGFKSKNRTILPKPSSSIVVSQKSRRIRSPTPPPLPPPPLPPSPDLDPIPGASFEVPDIIKSEKIPHEVPDVKMDRPEDYQEPLSSVIMDSNGAMQIAGVLMRSSYEKEPIPANEDGSFHQDDQSEHGSDYEDEELQEKPFQSIEIEEEKKVEFTFELENPETETGEGGKMVEESDAFEESENPPAEEENARVGDIDENAFEDLKKMPAPPHSNERTLQISEIRNFSDLKSVTYTDLQPATNSKLLQDLGITTSFNLDNYMEVDGVKIYFNNANVQNLPLEPIIKFTSSMKDVAKTNLKSEEAQEGEALVESVIHLVSGAQKSDFSGETYHNSNSEMDLRDLSPLTLNIRADESMPARGELSEQESLGAENSNWGLFHSEVTTVKSVEEIKIGSEPPASVNGIGTKKSFECSLCGQVFSCLKDRRLHRRNVHEKTRPLTRRPKVYVCPHCKEKFNSLRDRRDHVLQNHFLLPKKDNNVKQEVRDESALRSEVKPEPMTIKQEQEEATVKTEDGSKCEVTKNCPGCHLPFTGLKKLKEHLKEVHGVSRYKCGTCSETFDTEREFNSHLRIHPLECNQCGKLFSRKPNLKLHLRRHLLVKPYVCTQCPKSFITRQKLDEHLNSHSGNKPLKCSLCDRTFSRHSNLIQHRNIHHLYGKKKVKDFVCRCGEVFHSMRKLEWHKEVHDQKPKTCPFCSQKFIHSSSVTRHIRRSHIPHYLPNDKKDIENVQCPVCGKIYLRSSLLVHMRVHNGEKPFVCKICNKSFTTKWNLELHNWTHQSRNNMPYKCTACKSAFFREVDYVAHMNSHRNYKPFTCNICGQKFIRKYNCLRHQDEHRKEKRFVCTVSGCEKSFHRSYYLRDHMRVHTGVRPHTCHICGKASSTKSNHNKHVRIHDTREPLNTEN